MILCVGLNHATSSAGVREAVALSPEEAEAALEALRLGRRQEALILSTCNRTEFYTRGEEMENPVAPLVEILRSLKGVDLREHHDCTYVRRTAESVPHLFRVTAGLDSMVLGETEIAGQVRQAADLAARCGMSGTVLRRLVDSAVRCARRVRSETALTEGAISMASVAVGLAIKVLGPLGGKRVLLLGAGDTARLSADHLRAAGVRDFLVVNRTLSRAAELVERVGGRAARLEDLAGLLPEADLVMTATSSKDALVTVEMAREASRARRGRSMVYVDLAMPRDVHPDVNKLPNVFVYSTEAVKGVVEGNLERRRREAPRAEAIVVEESRRFLDWYRSLSVTPTMATMRAHVEALRAQKLERFAGRFRPEDRPHLEQLTKSLVQDILREPTLRLLNAKDDPRRGAELAQAVRHLFNLEEHAEGQVEDEGAGSPTTNATRAPRLAGDGDTDEDRNPD